MYHCYVSEGGDQASGGDGDMGKETYVAACRAKLRSGVVTSGYWKTRGGDGYAKAPDFAHQWHEAHRGILYAGSPRL